MPIETAAPPGPPRDRAELAVKILLRYIGTASLLALVAVFMPYEWMDATHRALGMGKLPAEPVVGYLARTASLFYALLGGLLWLISFRPRDHLTVLRYLAVAFLFFGVTVLWVDWTEQLPAFWRLVEGPVVLVFGGLLLWLCGRLSR
jgi:hypothetical protein